MSMTTDTAARAAAAPPVARRVPRAQVVHGERREDDYFWLRDKADPEVAAYLEAENAYADAATWLRAACNERRRHVSRLSEARRSRRRPEPCAGRPDRHLFGGGGRAHCR